MYFLKNGFIAFIFNSNTPLTWSANRKETHLAHTSGTGWTRCNKRHQKQETFPFWRTLGLSRPNWEVTAPPCWVSDNDPCLLMSLFNSICYSKRALWIGSPPNPVHRLSTKPTEVSTVKACDTEAHLLIPLISTASSSSSSSSAAAAAPCQLLWRGGPHASCLRITLTNQLLFLLPSSSSSSVLHHGEVCLQPWRHSTSGQTSRPRSATTVSLVHEKKSQINLHKSGSAPAPRRTHVQPSDRV